MAEGEGLPLQETAMAETTHNAEHIEHMRQAAGLVRAEQVSVWEDEFHVLHVRVDETQHDAVRPVRAFPISGRAGYVGFLNDKGKEVALLANPDDLDEDSRTAVERALDQNYFVPKIIRIDSISETWGVTHWQVETDCGRASFEVVDRERIRKLPGGRVIITDADENRYEVEDVEKLDPRSQTLLQSET